MASEAPMQPAPDSAAAAIVAPPERADEIFLEGPRTRFAEFCTLLKVMRDFLRGFRALHFVGPCVTVFGSARIKPDDPHYELARKMGARGKISASDLDLIYATNALEEGITHIRKKAIEPFELKRIAHMRSHFPWLGESALSGKGPDIC